MLEGALQATGTPYAAKRDLATAAILRTAAAVAIVYFLTAKLGLFLLAQPSDVAVFWPASGMAAGFLLLSGRRAYSALVIGVVVGTTVANLLGDRSLITSILKGFCNAGEAILVAWLLDRWFGPAFGFGDLRRVLGFFAAAVLAAAASAAGGAATMTVLHTTAPFWEVWRAWFLSDVVGIVVVAPFVVALGQFLRELPRRGELIEGGAVVGLLVLTSMYIVSRPTTSWVSFSPGALVLPMLLWLAARCPPTLTIAGAFVVSSAAICATIFGLGRFGDAAIPILERVKGAQVAATMVTAYTLVLVALFTERRQSEMVLKMALDGAKLGAFSANLATGRFECNLRTARMHGHNVPPATIKESRRFVHRDDLTRIDAALAKARGTGGVWNAEYRVMHPPNHPHAGETRWVAVESSLVCDSKGVPKELLGVTRDITHQKQAEQALAERNMQLSLAGKSALVGSYAYDPGTGVMQIDAGYAALHGLPEGTAETTRSEWRARVHPEDLVRLEKKQSQAFRDRWDGYGIVYRIVRSAGDVCWIESRSYISYAADGRPARVVGVNIDVTERRRTQQALIDRNNQIALSGKTALVGSFAIEIDPAQEHIAQKMRISPGFAAIFGLAAETEEISVSDWRSRVYPADLPQVLARRHQALAERRSEHQLEYRIVRACGTIRWIESRTSIEYDQAGQPSRLVGVNIDITERKKLEEQRKALIGELDHRVKNALSTVSAVISRTAEGSRSLADFVAALDGRIRSMAKTHELLSAHRWQGISLKQLIRNELAPFATGSNTDLDGPEVILTPEAGQATAMVLHELVTNAAKYGALSTQSGRVAIRWDRRLNGHPRSHLVLEWQETGGPPVIASARSSYGMSTIRDLLPYEFGAAVDFVLSPAGARCRVELPADWLSNGSEAVPEVKTDAALRTSDIRN